MTSMPSPPPTRVRVALGICVRALAGETESGDACASMPWSRGVLLAMADGLGHGERAALAAGAFLASVRDSVELPLEELFARAHRALLKTRGAVAAIARFDEDRGEVEIGVIGNITVQLARAGGRHAEHPLTIPGVLGSAYRSVRTQTFPFALGDLLFMCSDGVRSRFDTEVTRALPVQAAAESIVRANAKGGDDASCAVARGVLETLGRPTTPLPAADDSDRIIPLRVGGDAACAAHEARMFAKRLGLGARAEWEVSIAASELATNVLKYARTGELRLRHVRTPREAVLVEAIDDGRGIADVQAAIADGFTEEPARGLGVGLGSVHRLMDHVHIESGAGRGTRIVARKFR